ncbi:hypothetical protein [Mammaliicoccus lentus]|uniref:hypothetical protein n=1 Tax=Mammaliicoccus lentus TaxID=42858 RepID=UPI00264884B9|nr:hypothetical protein [Mammaliicoccus lentus]
MKREPVFIKPTYRYKGNVKEHTIERLEFIDVPENDIERLGLNIKRAGKKLKNAFSGLGRV